MNVARASLNAAASLLSPRITSAIGQVFCALSVGHYGSDADGVPRAVRFFVDRNALLETGGGAAPASALNGPPYAADVRAPLRRAALLPRLLTEPHILCLQPQTTVHREDAC